MVGVMDSGAGGLSFVRELFQHCPGHEVLYFADTGFFPYGARSEREIRERVLFIGRELIRRGAQTLVLACNTATAAAVDLLREEVEVPVVGVEPPVKPACEQWNRILCLVTPATAASSRFKRLCDLHSKGKELVVRPCPGLAERIEQSQRGTEIIKYFSEDKKQFEAVVLGCTHYELVREEIRSAFNGQIFSPSTGAVRRFASLEWQGTREGKNRFVLVNGEIHMLARVILGDLAELTECGNESRLSGD